MQNYARKANMSLPQSDATLESTLSSRGPSKPVNEVHQTSGSPHRIAQPVFNPGWLFYVAFISLSVISLMAALDATSISVALSVSLIIII